MAVRALFAALIVALAAVPALAHRLVVYAYVDGPQVVVEAKFSGGGPAKTGEVRLLDAANALLVTAPLDPDGETRLDLPERAAAGLSVEVETDAGHSDYWVLTPADIKAAQ